MTLQICFMVWESKIWLVGLKIVPKDVSNVKDMSSLFEDKTEFNDDISNWDTSNVTNMSNMFEEESEFNQPF